MSLQRFIFYGAVIGGWAAFAGWFLCEVIFNHRQLEQNFAELIFTGGLVGAAICAGLLIVSTFINPQWPEIFKRAGLGFGAGLLGGIVSTLLGYGIIALLGQNVFGYSFGWLAFGLGIGSVVGFADSYFDQNWKKVRNGVMGGTVGGFLGGLIFYPMFLVLAADSAMSSRATGFVVIGVCIGLFIGLAQVLLRDAWLTVEEGFRAGRQLILSQPETRMGTSEKSHLPFIAYGAQGVEPVHLKIIRQEDGSFVLYDNNSRAGTFVNEHRITQAVLLRDNDVIRLGVNRVRFQLRARSGDSSAPPTAQMPAPAQPASQQIQAHPAAPRTPPVPAAQPQQAVPASPAIRATPPPPRPVPATSPAQRQPVAASPKPQPAKSNAPAPQVSNTPAKAPCPICGRPQEGVPGKRLCASCRIHF